MPLYTLHTISSETPDPTKLTRAVAALHAQTFHTDPSFVRVERICTRLAGNMYTGGGVGWKPSTHFFQSHHTTDYLVAYIPFTGSAEEWSAYCGKLVALFGRGLRTVYLRRVEFEYEVELVGREGRVIGAPPSHEMS